MGLPINDPEQRRVLGIESGTAPIPGMPLTTAPPTAVPTRQAPNVNPTPGTNYQNPFATVNQQFGPQTLAQNAQTIYQQLVNSPFYRAQVGQILANQGMMNPALAAAQGQAGTSRTGVGRAKQSLQGVASQMQQQQVHGDLYSAALGAAQQNLGLQAGFLPSLYQVQNPTEYSPMQLQAERIAAEQEMQARGFDFQQAMQQSSQEFQRMMANLSFDQQTAVMRLANNLQKDMMRYGRDLEKEWDWGKFFSGISSFIPFL